MERTVVDELLHSLRVPRRRRQTISRELQSHLEDTQRDLTLAGWSPEGAERESVARLGSPEEIADGFSHVYRGSRRTQVGLAIALATGMLLGVWGIGGSLASATSTHQRSAHHTTAIHPTGPRADGHR